MFELWNFVDDNTLYSSNKELETVFKNLEIDLNRALSWFLKNSLKLNPANQVSMQ